MHRRGKRFYTVRWRMVMSYLLITLVGFAIVLVSLTSIVENYLVNNRVTEQQESVNSYAFGISDYISDADVAMLYDSAVEYSQKMSGRALVVDANSVVQIDAFSTLNGQSLNYPEINSVLYGGSNSGYGFHKTLQKNERTGFARLWNDVFPAYDWTVYYVSRLTDADGALYGAVVLSTSIQDVKESVASIRSQTLIVLVIVGVAILFAASLIARSITRPITELTRVIRRMGRGEFDLRVKVRGKSEVDELGRTFNDMSERLENTEKFRNEFVSNASHEIKTPLATMKILIESLLYQEHMDEAVTRDFLGDVNSEIDRLNLVISDLLKMVKFDQKEEELNIEQVDVRAVCEDVIKRLRPIAGQKGIAIQPELYGSSIQADPIKLEQVVFNIVENAIKYTDGEGTVNVGCTMQGGHALITVSDQGIGIPEKDIAHIFDRFYRVDKARARSTGGTGLGLSIVDKIVKLHGGRIEVESTENVGTTFRIYLPATQKQNREEAQDE